MQVAVTFRNIEATEALRHYAEAKVQRVAKYLRPPVEVHVILSVQKRRHAAEIVLKAKNASLNATETTGDLYSAIDLAADKIERQVKKLQSKRQSRQHVVAPPEAVKSRRRAERAPHVEVERVAVKPMSVGEALAELKGARAPLVVFQNQDNGSLTILYRRARGTFGLIEPEAD